MDFNITQNLLLRGGAIHPSLRQDESKCRKARVRLARLGGLAIAPNHELILEAPGTCHNSADASPARLRWMHIQLVPMSFVVVFCYQTDQFALLEKPRRNFDEHFW
jgi:hypothetical protein